MLISMLLSLFPDVAVWNTVTQHPTCTAVQCDKVAIVKDSALVYFGPYDATALSVNMPVDHMMGATVEGKESATSAAGDKVRNTCIL